MSDSYRRYFAVSAKLSDLLPEAWDECPTRLINLSLMVSATVKAKDLSQHALAAEMPLKAQDTSLAQRQRRWLMNQAVAQETYYEPIIKPFVQAMSAATVPLILDTTGSGGNCRTLTVALGYQRRALPIVWQSEAGPRGHTDGQLQTALLEKVIPLLEPESDVVLLGDGEFGHVHLLKWLQHQPWDYCLRVARDTYIYYEGQWRRIDSFNVQPGETLWLEDVYLTQSDAFGPVNLYLTWDAKNKRLVPLVTNLPLPEEVRYWYEKRFWIEPLFGDIKGHGFDFQTTRLQHPDRLARLMLAVSLAYLWLCFLGSLAILFGLAKLVDRSDRRDRSIFTIGRQYLQRLLKLDLPILVSFFPYPFLHLLPPVGGVG